MFFLTYTQQCPSIDSNVKKTIIKPGKSPVLHTLADSGGKGRDTAPFAPAL